MRPKSLHDLRGLQRRFVRALNLDSQDRVDAILDDERITDPAVKLALLRRADEDERDHTIAENFVLQANQGVANDQLFTIIRDYYVEQGYEVLRWYPHGADAEIFSGGEAIMLVNITNGSGVQSSETIQVTVSDFRSRLIE